MASRVESKWEEAKRQRLQLNSKLAELAKRANKCRDQSKSVRQTRVCWRPRQTLANTLTLTYKHTRGIADKGPGSHVIKRPLLFRWQKWKMSWWITWQPRSPRVYCLLTLQSANVCLQTYLSLPPFPCMSVCVCVSVAFDVISLQRALSGIQTSLTHYPQSRNYSYLSLWRQQLKASHTQSRVHVCVSVWKRMFICVCM